MLLSSVVQNFAAAMLRNDSGFAVCCTDPLEGVACWGLKVSTFLGGSSPWLPLTSLVYQELGPLTTTPKELAFAKNLLWEMHV